MGYTQIAVVSYIRRLLVYMHTYTGRKAMANHSSATMCIHQKKKYIYIYICMYVGYTLIAAVSYIRRLLVYMSAVAVLYTNISMIYIYIWDIHK